MMQPNLAISVCFESLPLRHDFPQHFQAERGPSLRSGFRLRALTPAKRLKFESFPLRHSFPPRSKSVHPFLSLRKARFHEADHRLGPEVCARFVDSWSRNTGDLRGTITTSIGDRPSQRSLRNFQRLSTIAMKRVTCSFSRSGFVRWRPMI